MEFSHLFISFILGFIFAIIMFKNSSGASVLDKYNFQWNRKFTKGTYGQMASNDAAYCVSKCNSDAVCKGIMGRVSGPPSCWKFKDAATTGPAVYDTNYWTWTKK
jgi:hypothetical protein